MIGGVSDITVVIPLYNKAPHIAAALESVLKQTVQPKEVIVVDDGSNDGGGSVVRGFQPRGVRLVTQANAGVSVARNVGTRIASGRFIAFLDADDAWLPHHLDTIVSLIRSFPGMALYSTLHQIDIGVTRYTPRSPFPLDYRGVVPDFFSSMANGLSLVNSTTACVERESLLRIGGFPEGVTRGEDLIVWGKLAARFGMAHASKVTAVYNRTATNRTSLKPMASAPDSLIYLASIMSEQSEPPARRRSATVLFDRIAFFTAAGMKEMGDIGGLRAIQDLAVETQSRALWLKLRCLEWAPKPALTLGRRLHQRLSMRRKSNEKT